MKSRRAAVWGTWLVGVGAAAAITLGGEREAHAGSENAAIGAGVGVLVGFLGADIAFAAHGLDAADKGYLARDGWIVAQTIVTVPQTLLFNTLLLGFNTEGSRTSGDLAMLVGLIPTIAVSSLTTHGIWAAADGAAPADALAGVSVLVGTNIALTSGTLGRAFTGRLHSRWAGIVEMVATAPGVGIGVYESTFTRDQQGAWIALTAWSGGLFVHGLASAIAGQTDDSDWQKEDEERARGTAAGGGARGRARERGWLSAGWRPPVTLAPAMVSDGVARVPGVMVSGVF